MKPLILLLIALLLPQTTYAQSEKEIDWSGDLDYLAKELADKHYSFFTVENEDYLLSRLSTIKEQSKSLSNFQVAVKTQQLIAEFGDSHTELYLNQVIDRSQMLPIQLLWSSDGLHILHTTAENGELLGRELLAINQTQIATVVDSINTLYVAENQSIAKSRAPQYMRSLQFLEHFGFAQSGQVELMLDGDQTYVLKPGVMDRVNRVSFKPDSVAFSIKNEGVFFTDSYYPEEEIYYMLYNRCYSKELEQQYGDSVKAKTLPSFAEFEKGAFELLTSKPIDKIIFDMRFNGGGNSAQGSAFIEKLAVYLEANPEVRIYVVVGRSTFSSAILNALDFKRLTNAIFVGEQTAGKPNHFGEVRSFQLPSSKLSVSYSTKYFKNSDKDEDTFNPDVLIEMSFSDLTKGIDPVYEWIKKQ